MRNQVSETDRPVAERSERAGRDHGRVPKIGNRQSAFGNPLKICDLTQFYSPLSGGVKRYVHEKANYIRERTTDEHLLIVPGEKTERTGDDRTRTYSIRSPLISRGARYRALLDLRAVGEILECEKPDI